MSVQPQKIEIIRAKQKRADRLSRPYLRREHNYELSRPWGYRHDDEKVENKLWVGNLDLHLTEYQLIKLFQSFGEVKHLDFLWHQHGASKGEPRGFVFVEMASFEDAVKAIEKGNGMTVMGRKMLVRFAKESEEARSARALDRTAEPEKFSLSAFSKPRPPTTTSTERQILQVEQKLLSMAPMVSMSVRETHPVSSASVEQFSSPVASAQSSSSSAAAVTTETTSTSTVTTSEA